MKNNNYRRLRFINDLRFACSAVIKPLTLRPVQCPEWNRRTAKSGFFALVCFLCFGVLAVRAADRYVVAPGTIADGQGGVYTDWGIAATQIQWAVDKATTAGDTVWVSNGVYVLTNQIVVTNAITLRSVNGPEATVINGGFVAGAPGATTNNRCLWMSNAAAFVHGFTISNGATMGRGAGVHMWKGILSNSHVRNNTLFYPVGGGGMGEPRGGGIYVPAVAATVTVCRISDNMVTNSDIAGAAGYGGGIYAGGGTGGELVDCVISNNVLYGGNNSYGGGADITVWRVRSCTIISNYNPSFRGGGIRLYAATMESSTVTFNRAKYGGGVYLQKGTITNCEISYNNNLPGGYASGIYQFPNAAADACEVYNTAIISNSPREGVYIYDTAYGRAVIANSIISGNATWGVQISGSGTNYHIYNSTVSGNAVYLQNGHIRNSLITGSTNLGGLFILGSCKTGLVSGCTIVNNRRSASAGSGIRIEASAANNLSISSCIIYSNGLAGTDDVFDAASSANAGALQYSCIGSNPGFTGSGIIVANPQFKEFAAGNYRLDSASPCVNTGSNENWMTNAVDLDGLVRIRYGTVDMGAYETIYQGTIFIFH